MKQLTYTIHPSDHGIAPTDIEAALALLNTQTEPCHLTVEFMPGVHRFLRSVELDATVVDPHRITFSGREGAVLTGRRAITAEWKPYKDGILQADIGTGFTPDALFVGGKKQILARYPNFVPDAVLNGYAEDAFSPERVARWADPTGGYIRALHHAEWGSNDYVITGKNPDNTLKMRWVGDNNRGREMHAVKRMVENIFEELDAPGEWFYNRQAGMLYYYPAEDVDVSTASVEVVENHRFFHLKGASPDAPLRHVDFTGLRFTNTARTLFTGEYERPLRGDWGIVRDGVILLENTADISITHCIFDDIGGNAVTMSAYNTDNTVSRCDFLHIGATGVLVTGLTSAVRDASCYDGDNHKTLISDYTPGPCSEDYPRDILITDCYFYDIGTYEKQTAAVNFSVSERCTVRRCTVHHTSRAGINIHDGTFGGHRIEDNDLFDCVTETADHGPINCWGRDRYWSVPQHDAMGYYGKTKRPFALLDARSTTVIRHNRVHANHAFGIDIDDGSSNYDIYDNLCIGVGIKLRDGFDRRVHNNLLIGSGFELHMTFAQNNDLIYTNVVVFPAAYNRLCINPGATTIHTNNLYWNMGHEVRGLPEEEHGARIADPKFTDFAGNDFSFAPDSPVRGMGFVPFPVRDENFGRTDCPNPPHYTYVDASHSTRTVRFHDLLLSDIDGEGMRSAAGLPDFCGVYIAERDVLGLFCKLGIPIGVGDVIREVGGVTIRNTDDFLTAFEAIPLNRPTAIVIYRSQKPLTLDFIKTTNDYQSINEAADITWKASMVEE